MKRVQGIGGIFIKGKNPKALEAWYSEHLGISPQSHSPWGEDDEAALLEWRDKDDPERKCYTVFSVFPEDTDYFEPSDAPYMLNFRVDDLDALLAELRQANVTIHGDIRTYPYGRFIKISDPEGTTIELWEPAEGF